ncbi:MAG: acyltransferase [Oscillospiraceae bacterium]|jgi:surface polysaccharide O-acyltransferase-like enzyme|nr:acyltransferase [Oscillospiraceae bacterium]
MLTAPAETRKERVLGLDILRTAAILAVICIHSLENTSYVTPGDTVAGAFGRSLFLYIGIISVPVFIMLTGYLQLNAKPTAKYFKGIFSILGIYVFYSIVTGLVRYYYFSETIPNETNIFIGYIKFTLTYFNIGYAWYVEMFIGLFFLVPYLSVISRSFKRQRDFSVFMIVLIGIFGVSESVNSLFGFKVLPEWWNGFAPNKSGAWPLVYFFAGAYIRRYQPKFYRAMLAVCYAGLILLFSVVTAKFRSVGSVWWSLPAIALSVLAFLTLYDLKSDNKPLRFVFKYTSVLSFEVFLISYIIDRLVWKEGFIISALNVRLPYYPLIILLIYLLSMTVAVLRYSACRGITVLFKKDKKWKNSI